MQLAPDRSIVCPFVIGRTEFLEPFERVVDIVCSGEGRVITIAGEAGIGKSRLVAELRACARAVTPEASLRVLEGHCFEPDESLPYAPMLDFLRTLLDGIPHDDAVALLGPEAGAIARLLPELKLDGAEAPWSEAEPEQERRRLFRALVQLITRLSREQPLLLVIEDVHWSDETSLECLLHLIRAIASERVLVLLTYRSDEVRPPLAHFLAALDRGRMAIEWPLRRLSVAEVSEMITAIFDLTSPPHPEFVRPLHELTEGNPFFIEEVLKSLIAAGDIFYANGVWDRKPIGEIVIPRSVQDAVHQRSSRLSGEARRILTYAAVAGRRFDFALLERVSGVPERELLGLVREMISDQMVIEESTDRFAFRHALTQQSLYADLLGRERRLLHQEIADAIEAMYGEADARLGELAYHYFEAGEWECAFEYASRAAERAQKLYAPAEAVAGFTRAIRAAAEQGHDAPAWIYRARGSSYESLGSFELARDDFERALALARDAGDNAAEWESLIRLGFLWATRDYERTGDFFRRALDLARASGDASLLARSLNRLGNWLVNTGRAAEGRAEHHAALEIFEANGDETGIAETFDLLGMANGMAGDVRASIEDSRQAIERLRALGDDLGLASSLTTRAVYSSMLMGDTTLSPLRPVEETIREGEEAMVVAKRSGSLAALSFAEWVLGVTMGSAGRFGSGVAHLREGLRIAEEIDHQQWLAGSLTSLGQVYWIMLDGEQAVEQLERALPIARAVKSAWWLNNISSYLTLAYVLCGELGRAETIAASAMRPLATELVLAERRVALAVGELALARGDASAALAAADQLLASVPGMRTEEGGDAQPARVPRLLLLRGRALTDLGRHEEASLTLDLALPSATERGDAPSAWRAHCARARLCLAMRDSEGAARAIAAARTAAETLAQSIDAPDARERFARAAESALPVVRAPTARQAAKQAFGGLTEREREVAVEITRGRSNREIAELLVLSERTIETHVGNILSKLGFTSRAQIAAWGVERGIASADHATT